MSCNQMSNLYSAAFKLGDIHNICIECDQNSYCFWYIWYENCVKDDMYCELEKMADCKEGTDWKATEYLYNTHQKSKVTPTAGDAIKSLEDLGFTVVKLQAGIGSTTMTLSMTHTRSPHSQKREAIHSILNAAGIQFTDTGK